MDYSNLFSETLITLDAEFTTQQNMFEKISQELYQMGYVTSTFKDAIIKREREYPTGLTTDEMKVAIPHTDVVHVQVPFIYVVTLKRSLPFIQMGTNDEWIDVENVFFLGIKEPLKQVGLLSLLMEVLQDSQFNEELNAISSSKQMESYFKKKFRSE